MPVVEMHNQAIGFAPTMLFAWESWVIYLAMISTYFPGIYFMAKNRWPLKFPVIVFFFAGMLVLQALGSILVLVSPHVHAGAFVPSTTYIWIVAAQPLVLYSCIYIFWRFGWLNDVLVKADRLNSRLDIDCIAQFCVLAFVSMLAIIGVYYINVGEFAIFGLFDGSLDHKSAGAVRAKLTYGVRYYAFYRFGFVVLPILVASAAAILITKRGLGNSRGIAMMLIAAFVAPLLNAEKTGVLVVAFCFLVAVAHYRLSQSDKWPAKINASHVLLISALFVPTLVVGHLYYGDDLEFIGKIEVLAFRIFGSYSQATAASIAIAQDGGFFNGLTLPTVHGLFPHSQILIEDRIHLYVTGWRGSTPVSSAAEGYINFGWPGFLLFSFLASVSVIFVQKLLINIGTFGVVIQALYAYFAFMLSATGFFQTIGSLTTTAAVVLMYVLYHMVCRSQAHRQVVP